MLQNGTYLFPLPGHPSVGLAVHVVGQPAGIDGRWSNITAALLQVEAETGDSVLTLDTPTFDAVFRLPGTLQ